MIALVLALSLTAGPDGGVLAAIEGQCPDVSDAGEAVHLDMPDGGGWWLPDPRGARLACRLSSCEAYAESPPMVTPVVIVTNIITAILGVVASLITAFVRK